MGMTGKLKLTARRRKAVAMMVQIARKDRKTPVSLADYDRLPAVLLAVDEPITTSPAE